MVLVTRPDQSFKYVTLADRRLPKAQQTTWMLRLLTPKQRSWVAARSGTNNWEIMDVVCQAGLVDAINLLDPWGAAVPYAEERTPGPLCGDEQARENCVTMALLRMIPPEVKLELMAAILNGAVMSEEDAGN